MSKEAVQEATETVEAAPVEAPAETEPSAEAQESGKDKPADSFDAFADIPRRDPDEEPGPAGTPSEQQRERQIAEETPAETPPEEAPPEAEPAPEESEAGVLRQVPLAELNELYRIKEEFEAQRTGRAPVKPPEEAQAPPAEDTPPPAPEQAPQAQVRPFSVPEVTLPQPTPEEWEQLQTDYDMAMEYNQARDRALVVATTQAVLDNIPGLVHQKSSESFTANFLSHQFIRDHPEYFNAPYVVKAAVNELLAESPGGNPFVLFDRIGDRLKLSAQAADKIAQQAPAHRPRATPPPTMAGRGQHTRDASGRFAPELSEDATEQVFQRWRMNEKEDQEAALMRAGLI